MLAGVAVDALDEMSQPEHVGQYRVMELVGFGGSGVVFRAEDTRLRRQVALKLLRNVAVEPAERSRLMSEARLAAALSHPHVVTVFEVGQTSEGVFLAMEWCPNGSLAVSPAALRSWRDGLALMLDAGEGLSAAHHAGITHGDFKPANVLVDARGRAKVADFGLARLSKARTARRVGGTKPYLAPEVVAGVADGPLADQYAYCVCVVEVLRHERLRDELSPEQAADAVRSLQVPRGVKAALMRGLSREPSARYPTMPQLLADLARATKRPALWPVVAAAAAVGVTSAALVALRPAPCSPSAETFDGHYAAAQRAGIAAAFARSPAPYLGAVFERVSGDLDAYAASFRQAARQACDNARSTDEAARARAQLSQACLVGAIDELDAALGVLQSAEAPVLSQAPLMLGSLPSPSRCISHPTVRPEAIGAAKGPEGAARALARKTLLEAQALAAAEQPRLGAPLAERAVAQARALGDERLEAEALYWLARCSLLAGDRPAAERSLADAERLAERAQTLQLVVSCRLLRARLVMQIGDEGAQAKQLLQSAEPLIERAVGDDELLKAALLIDRSYVFVGVGRNKDALSDRQQALSIRERLLGAHHPLSLSTALNVALALRALDRLGEAEAILRQTCEAMGAAYSFDHPQRAHCFSELGNLLTRVDRDVEALEYLESAATVLEAALGARSDDAHRALRGLVWALVSTGQYRQAIVRAKANMALSDAFANDPFLLMPVAYAHRRLGEFDVAEEVIGHAYDVFETKWPGSKYCGAARLHQGALSLERRQWAVAKDRLSKAIALLERDPQANSYLLAAFAAQSRALYGLGDYQAARELAAKAVTGLEGRADSSKRVLAEAHFALARAIERTDGARAPESHVAGCAALAEIESVSGAEPEQLEIRAWAEASRARGQPCEAMAVEKPR